MASGRQMVLSAILGTMIAPLPVSALDCAEYTVESAFWGHKQRAETFELVYGQFSDLRNPRHDRAADTVTWDATFTGYRGTRHAFDQPLLTEVTIFQQLGTGIFEPAPDPMGLPETLPPGAGLIFLQQSANGYMATNGYCWPMVDVDPANVATALDCLNGQRCPKPE